LSKPKIIWIIEDNPGVLEQLKKFINIRFPEHTVIAISNLFDADYYLHVETKCDLMIMDLEVPGFDEGPLRLAGWGWIKKNVFPDARFENTKLCISTGHGNYFIERMLSVDDRSLFMKRHMVLLDKGDTNYHGALVSVVSSLQSSLQSKQGPFVAVPQTKAKQEPRTAAAEKSVFISYAHKDKRYLDEMHPFLKALERTHQIQFWDDTKIQPGEHWKESIEQSLQAADFAVLLLSANFFASDFCQDTEVPAILKRAKESGAKILSVPVSTYPYHLVDWAAAYQAVWDLDKPLEAYQRPNRNKVYAKLIEIISKG